MKVSFDGLRKNIINAYNKTVSAYHEEVEDGFDMEFGSMKDGLDELRQMIVGLLCCYDTESIERDNDFNDLSDLSKKLLFADPKDDDDSDSEDYEEDDIK